MMSPAAIRDWCVEAYLLQPEILRKAERDFVTLTGGAIVISGVIDANHPDWRMIVGAVGLAAGQAAWRVGRKLLQGPLLGLPYDPPDPPLPPAGTGGGAGRGSPG